jgi:hypothetical protein
MAVVIRKDRYILSEARLMHYECTRKLGIELLVSIALTASDFQGTTLAADSSQTSLSLHAKIHESTG